MPEPVSVDLSSPRRVHVVGIGGAGMSAIAAVLAQMGHRVSGSDLKPSATLERLASLGITTMVGHRTENLPADAEIVTRSTAVPDTNPEVVAARERGLPVARRADTLAAIAATKPTVAVCGTHGKTTTASMLVLALLAADLRPSFIIGGEPNEIGGGAAWDDEGELFVVEADESDGTFLELGAWAVVVTSVEPDHLEHWGSFEALQEAFATVVAGADGPRVVCADDRQAAAVARRSAATTYGFADHADLRITGHRHEVDGQSFAVERDGTELATIDLPVPGLHNARNATGAFAAAVELGAEPAAAAAGLSRYTGVARRFERRGEAGGVRFVDDYAHLPTEISVTVDAARRLKPQRVVCVFQPHRYSRTEALHRSFAGAFDGVDHVVITDVYPAGEDPRPGVTGQLVADAVAGAPGAPPLSYVSARSELVDRVTDLLRPGDLCLTLGAGDLTSLPGELMERLGEGG